MSLFTRWGGETPLLHTHTLSPPWGPWAVLLLRPRGPPRRQLRAPSECRPPAGPPGETAEPEGVSWVSRAWVWDGPVLSQNDPSTSQTRMCFRWAHLPTNPFLPRARRTGLLGPAPPPPYFDVYGTCARLPPGPTPSLVPEQVEGFFLYPLVLLALLVLSIRMPRPPPHPASTLVGGWGLAWPSGNLPG